MCDYVCECAGVYVRVRVCVSMWGHMCKFMQVPAEVRRRHSIPGAGVAGGCETPVTVCAGNRALPPGRAARDLNH